MVELHESLMMAPTDQRTEYTLPLEKNASLEQRMDVVADLIDSQQLGSILILRDFDNPNRVKSIMFETPAKNERDHPIYIGGNPAAISEYFKVPELAQLTGNDSPEAWQTAVSQIHGKKNQLNYPPLTMRTKSVKDQDLVAGRQTLYHIHPEQLPSQDDQTNLRNILINHPDSSLVLSLTLGAQGDQLTLSTADGSASAQLPMDDTLCALLGIPRNEIGRLPFDNELAKALQHTSYNGQLRDIQLLINGQTEQPSHFNEWEGSSTQFDQDDQGISIDPRQDMEAYFTGMSNFLIDEELNQLHQSDLDQNLAHHDQDFSQFGNSTPDEDRASIEEAHALLDEMDDERGFSYGDGDEDPDRSDDPRDRHPYFLEKNDSRSLNRRHKRDFDSRGLHRRDHHYSAAVKHNNDRRGKGAKAYEGRGSYAAKRFASDHSYSRNIHNTQELDLHDSIPDQMLEQEQKFDQWLYRNQRKIKPRASETSSIYHPMEWSQFHRNEQERPDTAIRMIDPAVDLIAWPETQKNQPGWWKFADNTSKSAFNAFRYLGMNPLKWQGSGNAPYWFTDAPEWRKATLNALALTTIVDNQLLSNPGEVEELVKDYIKRHTAKTEAELLQYSRRGPKRSFRRANIKGKNYRTGPDDRD